MIPSTMRVWATVLLASTVAGVGAGLADAALSRCGLALTSAIVLGGESTLLVVIVLAVHGAALTTGRMTRGHLAPHAFVAVAWALALYPAWTALFSGAGVRRTALGVVGPFVAAFGCAVLGVAVHRWLVPALAAADAPRRWFRVLIGGTCLYLASMLLLVDRLAYVGHYPGVHLALGIVTLGLATLSLLPLLGTRVPPTAAVVGAGAVLVAAGVALARPLGTNTARVCLAARPGLLANFTDALLAHVDLDGDGVSALLGAGDCNDLDASVGLGAVEHVGDRIDSDCDGRDDPVALAGAPTFERPYRTDPVARERLRKLAAGRPTVVLLIDALRRDRIDRPEFVHLARLAARAIRVEHAYAHSTSTGTSLPTMLTGRVQPPATEPTLATRLGAAGRASAYVGLDDSADTITLLYPGFRGFDRVEKLPSSHNRRLWGGGVTQPTSDEITSAALRLLDSREPPDLLWVHYFDVHQWHALAPLAHLAGEARYDASVALVDRALAPWLDRIDEWNVVLVSDHGELFGAHRRFFHTRRVAGDLARVPWLVSIPGAEPTSITAPLGLSDLAPLLWDLAGDGAAPTGWERRSLLGLVGVADPGEGPPILAFERYEWSLLDAGWRLLLDPRAGTVRLFDMRSDPQERTDLAARHVDRAAHMADRLRHAARAIEDDRGPIQYANTD